MGSLQGHLLVASPHLRDPNFAQAVVLLIEHNDDGAFGLVLNRPISKTIQELWEEVHEPPCENQQHLNLGGPVSGPLMALHTDPELSEVEIVPGVHFSASKQHLERLVQQQPTRLRLFVGHSGWGGGQLEEELKQGAWLNMPATIEHVFLEEDQLWKTVTRAIGASMLVAALGIKHVPADPSLN